MSVEELLDRTNSLSYFQLVIQATQRLTSSIIKSDCKGLKDFFQCDLEVKRTTRYSDKGNLIQPLTMNKTEKSFSNLAAGQFYYCVIVALQSCVIVARVARLRDCCVAKLRDCCVARFRDSCVARLRDYCVARLRDCCVARLSDCCVALQGYKVA
jgi:hypothetical protein